MPNNKKSFLKSKPKGSLTLREMFTRPLIYGTAPSSPKWSPDGKTLAFLWNAEGEPRLDIYVSYDDSTSISRLTDSSKIDPLPVEDDERPKAEVDYSEVMFGGVGEFEWIVDRDENGALTKQWIIYNCRGNLFKVSIPDGETVRLTQSTLGVGQVKVSPDNKNIGYLLNSNVWSYNVETGATTQVTYFNKDQVSVVQYAWSPDSKSIGLYVEDRSMFETVKMPDYSPENEVKINELRRNNAGKPRVKCRFGIVPSAGGKMAQIALPNPEETANNGKPDSGINLWFHSMNWTQDGSKLILSYVGKSNRDWHITAVTPGFEATPTEIYNELSEPWADWSQVYPSPDSKYAYFLSYRSNWRQIYRVPTNGGEIETITTGEFDITGIQIPKYGKQVIFTANAPYPTENQVFTIDLEGGEQTMLSPEGTTWSSVTVSDDGNAHAFLSSAVMVQCELFRKTGDGPFVKLTNSALPQFDSIPKPQVKRFTFKNETDGAEVHARMILPHNFDPNKKYPVVLTCVYAGAGKEGFGRYQVLDTYMANEMGYILVGIDIRASMGYGKDFFYGYFKKLGIIDAEECVSCANHLKTLPYIDSERIGIWGGSYGGFLVLMLMCNHPGVFHTGISWKPVTDWRNYWDGYINPRLTTPQEDPEIYKVTSPVFFADGLEGNLLLVHGMLDDNVLFQDAAWMIQKMIESGKYFDLMIYPRDDHGLTRRHESLPDCMERFAAYFEEHMGLGPIEE